MESDASWCDVFDDDGVAQLKEVWQVCTCVFAWQATELAHLYHRNQASPEPKVYSVVLTAGLMGMLATTGVEYSWSDLAMCEVADGTGVTGLIAGGVAEEMVRELFFLKSASRLSVSLLDRSKL
jgi:hypothetical protein